MGEESECASQFSTSVSLSPVECEAVRLTSFGSGGPTEREGCAQLYCLGLQGGGGRGR